MDPVRIGGIRDEQDQPAVPGDRDPRPGSARPVEHRISRLGKVTGRGNQRVAQLDRAESRSREAFLSQSRLCGQQQGRWNQGQGRPRPGAHIHGPVSPFPTEWSSMPWFNISGVLGSSGPRSRRRTR